MTANANTVDVVFVVFTKNDPSVCACTDSYMICIANRNEACESSHFLFVGFYGSVRIDTVCDSEVRNSDFALIVTFSAVTKLDLKSCDSVNIV